MDMPNLFTHLPPDQSNEAFDILLENQNFRLERIVSHGQSTPPGQWLDQERDEWVVLLSGSAGIQFQDESETRNLKPGDYLLIPAHRRHRVDWTAPGEPTVWLALHFVS